VDIYITDHLLMGFVAFVSWSKSGNTVETVHQLFIDFKKAYD
jgi:hypothetical protein